MKTDSKTINPGATIGILGGGQLGKMLALAASYMGYKTCIFSPTKDECGKQVTNSFIDADYLDFAKLDDFAKQVDVITYEFENIPLKAVQHLEEKALVRPGSGVLSICQNRIREKTFVSQTGVATNNFAEIKSADDLKAAIKKIGTPSVIKTAEMGYDGKGQAKIKADSNLEEIWKSLNCNQAILEEFIDFEKEISAIVARNANGEIAVYPIGENSHKNHILDITKVPAEISDKTAKQAKDAALKIAEKIGLVGILAIEMFVTKSGDILVNELAPRPHNSGHWSIEGAITSQFEQTIRAVCNLSLGATDMLASSVEMTNLIGDDIHEWEKFITDKTAKLHLYGKGAPKPGRKMGHVTVLKK